MTGEATMSTFSPQQAGEFGRRGGGAIVSPLGILRVVCLQPAEVVLKAVLHAGEALEPCIRIMEVYR
jgi:hypothetical protein